MLIKILLQYIFGYLKITVEGYYIERFINICTNSKILIWNLKRERGVKLFLNIGITDYYKAVKIAKKLKCKIKINNKKGMPFLLNRYKKRKIFVVSLILIITLFYVSSKYIWNIEIQIEGNYKMENITDEINNAGLKIGMKKNEINVQEIINRIRLNRNDISWMGINVKGTNAIVKIVTSKQAPKIIDYNQNCDIIAKKSGTITKIIAQNGTAMVKQGDEVSEGQILIQGIMEGKFTGIRYVHSLGEIEAIVKYSKNERMELKRSENVKTGKKEKKYQIKINNFQINFYKTLSKFKIYDKIEENKKIKLFSDFYLPISVNKITINEIEEKSKEYSIEEATLILTNKLEKEIESEIDHKEKIIRKKC